MARIPWGKTRGWIQKRLAILPRYDHDRLSLQLSNLTQVFAQVFSPARLQRCLVTGPCQTRPGPSGRSPDLCEEKLWCSSSIYDSDRASDTSKPTEEVQGESATTLPATTASGNKTNPIIPTLVVAIRERSKALSRILVEDQGRDESEKYREHIKEATDCYISTVEDLLEHAKRAEKSQWKDLEG
uniref:Uncharacterized protein n=1 Tax=Bionectria ochroleuca TaxID=29856 RepID=A0A8H7TQZ7_BIOOC